MIFNVVSEVNRIKMTCVFVFLLHCFLARTHSGSECILVVFTHDRHNMRDACGTSYTRDGYAAAVCCLYFRPLYSTECNTPVMRIVHSATASIAYKCELAGDEIEKII